MPGLRAGAEAQLPLTYDLFLGGTSFSCTSYPRRVVLSIQLRRLAAASARPAGISRRTPGKNRPWAFRPETLRRYGEILCHFLPGYAIIKHIWGRWEENEKVPGCIMDSGCAVGFRVCASRGAGAFGGNRCLHPHGPPTGVREPDGGGSGDHTMPGRPGRPVPRRVPPARWRCIICKPVRFWGSVPCRMEFTKRSF